MKLKDFVGDLCEEFSLNLGCNKCPHFKKCAGYLWDEIKEKGNIEIERC